MIHKSFCTKNPPVTSLQLVVEAQWETSPLITAEDEGGGECEPDKVGAKQGVKQGVQGKVK